MVWIKRRKRPFDMDLSDIFDYIDYQIWNAFEAIRRSMRGIKPFEWRFVNYELVDEGDKYVIEMELPGVNKKDIEINVIDNMLEISVKKKEEIKKEEEGYYISKRYYAGFREVISLPSDADTENIKARYNNGILRIEIGKKASKGKRVTLE